MTANNQKKILALTLYSGENEFNECQASVKAQTGVNVNHEVFENLSNIEAHKALYKRIMDCRDKYDLFLKLDADMVLNRPTALSEVANFFSRYNDVDHMVALVNDHYTGGTIFGVHTYTANVDWELETHDRLFVDPDPKLRGRLVRDPKELPIFVEHAPNPSPYQCFHFGFHRMLKAVQPESSVKIYAHTKYQLSVLRKVEQNYLRTKRNNLGLAILGADLVREGVLSAQTGDKKELEVKKAFQKISALDEKTVYRRVSRKHYWRGLTYFLLRESMKNTRNTPSQLQN